ncbi:hypothetical protein [Burkholderia savannae]|uniref:hypothetical protein n=1 Tax=Burkholderia savannae TaxID=1637837 RepID=UPI000755C233|nr:hypothetical protein WS78_30330 [Burkholderia savannae]KVG44816.1 hypothetical protein WS77_06420 [Burkholderia sp. MSMB0265]KVG79694.1 hypothetical protein WS81_14735 [Burkholderia sp. MSMB2040]KVG95941.1 hypothetical protein WS82_01830 [Burkholderia sp. MSMB2041]KVG97047.1 hypothetical protein WS83_31750 [Burkholderia sp. MSMB2042]
MAHRERRASERGARRSPLAVGDMRPLRPSSESARRRIRPPPSNSRGSAARFDERIAHGHRRCGCGASESRNTETTLYESTIWPLYRLPVFQGRRFSQRKGAWIECARLRGNAPRAFEAFECCVRAPIWRRAMRASSFE